MDFKGFYLKFSKIIWTTVAAIVMILTTAAVTGSAAAKSFDGVIDSRIDNRIDARLSEKVIPKLDSIDEKLSYLVSMQQADFVKSIEKQVEKINTDPKDIKIVDIESIMKNWKTFPEDLKTDDLVAKYEIIKHWYSSK